MARRSRLINSSLLPENMGPQTTSIQPILPVMKSITERSSLFVRRALLSADRASWTIFANHHGILNGLRVAFDGDCHHRVVGGGLWQACEADAEFVLRKLDGFARR